MPTHILSGNIRPPLNIFPGVPFGITLSIWLPPVKKEYPFEKKYIELTAEDRAKVANTFHTWQTKEWTKEDNVPEYCYSATFEEVKDKGFSLVPSKYIEFVNRDENIDYDTKMRALQEELTDLLKQEEQSTKDLLAVFKELGYEIKL